jgi:hypothetical protein
VDVPGFGEPRKSACFVFSLCLLSVQYAQHESQRNNILDAKPDLETKLRKTLLNLCFTAAIQVTIQYGQAAESETHINNKKIHLKKIQRDNIKKKYSRLWVFGGLKIF